MRFAGLLARAASALVPGVLFACGGEPTGPDETAASSIAIMDAPPASARSGVPFDAAPKVRLADVNGAAVRAAGVEITASVDGGTIAGAATATTGADGTALFTGLAVTSAAGTRTISFSSPGLATAHHQLVITAGLPATIAASSASTQSGLAGREVALPPSVLVADGAGNPVAGALVAFAITAGNGTLTSASVATSAAGIATVGSWTLGVSPGANTVRATLQGLAGAGVTFQAFGTLQAPARVLIHEGATQTADLNAAVLIRPAVQVVDAEGVGVAGAAVSFEIVEGSGSVAGQVQVTDPQGIARVGSWTIGGMVALYRMHAIVPGVEGSPAVFEAIGRGIGNFSHHAGQAQAGTAGSPVAVRPAARILDRFGAPVAGVTVTFRVASGGGSVSGAAQVTDASGVATVGAWTLGATLGQQLLHAEADDVGASPLAFSADAQPPAPTSRMSAHAGMGQSARINTAVPEAPAVIILAADGTPVANHPVTFTAEGGTITNSSTVTDANGVASAGTWTLSEHVGTHDVVATASNVLGTPIRFQAVATPGPPARVYFGGSADVFNSVVGAATQFIPTAFVVDEGENPLSGVTVTFSVTAGSVSGNVKQTTADGWAEPDSWVLGTVAGIQQLTATVAGLPPATRAINATAGPPASIAIAGGDGQTAGVRRMLPSDLVVRYEDQYGNPVRGLDVVVSLPGGGEVSGMQVSGADGLARFRVRLGSTPGPQSIIATHSGVPGSATFAATATPVNSQYAIELRYLSGISASQQAQFAAAVARWSDIILGDVPELQVTLGAGLCFDNQPALDEVIDDMVIFIDVRPIDGVGQVLGAAGPCIIRASSSLPAVGLILLDAADVASLESNGRLQDVILHEMAHTLGFGSEIWSRLGLLTGAGTANPIFTGAFAVSAYHSIGGAGTVPVENTGGGGTADSHWRETVFSSELMTGFLNIGSNPLTVVTIGSLQDLGYDVDYGTAETFGFGPSFRRDVPETVRQLREVPLGRPVIVVRQDGTVVSGAKR
ncbi:MAG TPA: leishmanolysin-related zinc metalloendopeptidase [Gemmatimonadales bacterium]|nr:leishmanolysin-related zinc metalloendopeptidase [Gemmatimonadales bacterium]